ncbi:hypothetical protein V1Y59_09300 [Gordonia sp. PKS22-38]|uniref:Lipoprotein n=1 Tax=Gordonia prachuapensis TaxID=3115651 RepID=A0ABU7MSI6_9ACTN|nr:hypothetical protein [Gordonia sp. PKS22-38]
MRHGRGDRIVAGVVGDVTTPSVRRAGGLAVLALIAVGCASPIDGSGTAAPGEVTAYEAQRSASIASSIRQDGVDLCRQAMSSMVVMVRGYNVFVERLSEVHAYGEVGDLDEKARASLIAGSDQIRGKLTEKTPEDVREPTTRFLDSTARLGDAIGDRRLTGLNPVAVQWTRDKRAVLDTCERYLPIPPVSDASPAPEPGDAPATAPDDPAPPTS